MYAIIKTGGKQYRVAVGDRLKVETLSAEPGDKLELDQVLMISDNGNVQVGTPVLEGASVSVTVLGEGRGDKIKVFKMHRRQGYRRTQGHRQNYTELEISAIGGSESKNKKAHTKAQQKPVTDESAAKATTKSAAKDTTKSAAKATTKSAAKDTTKSAAKDTTKSAAKATTKSAAKATTKSAAKDTTKSAAKATTKSAAKATTKSAAKDTTKSAAKDTTKSAAKDTTKSAAKATTKSAAKDTTKSAAKATTKSAAKTTTQTKDADDLTEINGIGPVIAGKLNALGYTKFSQIAALSDEAADEINSQLSFKGRIEREQWIEQAKALIT